MPARGVVEALDVSAPVPDRKESGVPQLLLSLCRHQRHRHQQFPGAADGFRSIHIGSVHERPAGSGQCLDHFLTTQSPQHAAPSVVLIQARFVAAGALRIPKCHLHQIGRAHV